MTSEKKLVSVVVDGRRRVHSTWADGAEMIEEFDAKTHELLLRKRRRKTLLGGEGEWIVEVGAVSGLDRGTADLQIAPSASSPVCARLDTKEQFQWRIRNLPFEQSVYAVTIDEDQRTIVVRTSNKKYFKRIDIPDMERLGLRLTQTALSWKHQHNTLVVSYTKPSQVLDSEKKHLNEALQASLTV